MSCAIYPERLSLKKDRAMECVMTDVGIVTFKSRPLMERRNFLANVNELRNFRDKGNRRARAMRVTMSALAEGYSKPMSEMGMNVVLEDVCSTLSRICNVRKCSLTTATSLVSVIHCVQMATLSPSERGKVYCNCHCEAKSSKGIIKVFENTLSQSHSI